MALLDSSTPGALVARVQDITPEQARSAIVGVRLALAAGTLLAPRATSRLFGIDPDDNPAAPYLARLFGVRDGWLAAEVLLADDEDDRRDLLLRHVAIDVLDVGSAVLALRAGHLPRRAAVLAGLTAAVVAGLGVIALQD